MTKMREVIIPKGRASVSDKKIEQAVVKVMKMREAGEIKPNKHPVVIKIAEFEQGGRGKLKG